MTAGVIRAIGTRSSAVVIATSVCAMVGCRNASRTQSAAGDGRVVAFVGGTVYRAPDAEPMSDGVVVVDGDLIVNVGARANTPVPREAMVVDARGRAILPGFWNSHVHFTEPKWTGADTMSAERLSDQLRAMLTRFGFVHVVDIASFPNVTLALRRRVRAGEVLGPDILTTLVPFIPPNGRPRYLPPSITLPELRDPASARDSVRSRLSQGADGIKLFSASLTRAEPFPVMARDVVEAVSQEAHRAGRFVVAHPTNLAGVEAAVYGGVDILAHTAPMARVLPDSLFDDMHRRGVAWVPTLTLWEDDYGADTAGMGEFMRAAQRQVRAYADRGGRILFGTDVGYLSRYDPTREYELMQGAGLDFHAILMSLTTAPADEFGLGARTGRLARGLDADLVMIDGDPAQDVRTFARVRLAMKRGKILYDASGQR